MYTKIQIWGNSLSVRLHKELLERAQLQVLDQSCKKVFGRFGPKNRSDLPEAKLIFDPQSGHEQKGRRPALVISKELFG